MPRGERRCSRSSCRNVASWQPVVVLETAVDGGARRTLLPLPLQLCDEHRGHGRKSIPDVLGAAGLDLLKAAVKDEFGEVDWARSRIRFLSLRKRAKTGHGRRR